MLHYLQACNAFVYFKFIVQFIISAQDNRAAFLWVRAPYLSVSFYCLRMGVARVCPRARAPHRGVLDGVMQKWQERPLFL